MMTWIHLFVLDVAPNALVQGFAGDALRNGPLMFQKLSTALLLFYSNAIPSAVEYEAVQPLLISNKEGLIRSYCNFVTRGLRQNFEAQWDFFKLIIFYILRLLLFKNKATQKEPTVKCMVTLC